jgi:hypothetical protein
VPLLTVVIFKFALKLVVSALVLRKFLAFERICWLVSYDFVLLFELVDLPLKLVEMQLQVFVHFAHFQVLLFEVLPALFCRIEG